MCESWACVYVLVCLGACMFVCLGVYVFVCVGGFCESTQHVAECDGDVVGSAIWEI